MVFQFTRATESRTRDKESPMPLYKQALAVAAECERCGNRRGANDARKVAAEYLRLDAEYFKGERLTQ